MILFLLAFFEVAEALGQVRFIANWEDSFEIFPTPAEFSAHKNSIQDRLQQHSRIFAINPDLYCKYPARYHRLVQEGLLPLKDFGKCHELREFFEKAPIDKLSLVFASESLTQPSSIMGHAFLKLTGLNLQNEKREHSISFFTRMDDVNPLQLIAQSFVTGKKGFYVLGPFSETVEYYLRSEGRNLWEYELKLSPGQLEFLRLYLFELKHTEFKYYFHVFNCATLIQGIIAAIYPEVKTAGHLWVTPLDVVKTLHKHELVQERKVYPNSTWLVKQLGHLKEYRTLGNRKDDQSEFDQAIVYHYQKAYQSSRYESGEINLEQLIQKTSVLESEFTAYKKYDELSFLNLKGPESTIQDSQIVLSAIQQEEKRGFGFYILPLSHQISNDLGGYSFESDVRLLGIGLTLPETETIRLSSIDIFKVSSFKYHDDLTGGLSGQFHLVYKENSENIQMIHGKSMNASLSVGKTYRIKNDVDFYIWPSIAFTQSNRLNLMANPQFGFIMRQIYKMKLVSQFEHQVDTDKHRMNIFQLIQSINLDSYSAAIEYRKHFNDKVSIERTGLSFSIFF